MAWVPRKGIGLIGGGTEVGCARSAEIARVQSSEFTARRAEVVVRREISLTSGPGSSARGRSRPNEWGQRVREALGYARNFRLWPSGGLRMPGSSTERSASLADGRGPDVGAHFRLGWRALRKAEVGWIGDGRPS